MKTLKLCAFTWLALPMMAQTSLGNVPYPNGIAFTSSNQAWVASTYDGFTDLNSGAMYRINATDTAILGAKQFPAYEWGVWHPVGVGGSIWLVGQLQYHNYDLIQMDGTTGHVLFTYPNIAPLQSFVNDVQYDATSNALWITAVPLGFGPATVTRFSLSTQAVTATYALPTIGSPGQSLVKSFQDSSGHVWVLANTALSTTGAILMAINKADGSTAAIYNKFPYGATYFIDALFDGANIWLSDSKNEAVYNVNPATGMSAGVVISSHFDNLTSPAAMVFDGVMLWITTSGDTVYEYRLNGQAVAFYGLDTVVPLPAYMPPDQFGNSGALWVAGYNSNTVDRLSIPAGQ